MQAINVTEAPRLVRSLSAWSPVTSEVRSLVHQAQVLCDLPVNVDLVLDQIGEDGDAMAHAVQRAIDIVLGYQLQIQPLHKHRVSAKRAGTAEASRVASLVTRIGQLGAVGRDPSAEFEALFDLLGPDATSAVSFLLGGVNAAAVLHHFADGDDAAFERVAAAMAQGLSPSAAGLDPAFFPAEYVSWHQAAADIASLRSSIESTQSTLEAIERNNVNENPVALAEVTAVLGQLPRESLDPNLAYAFDLVLASGGRVDHLSRSGQSILAALVKERATSAENAIGDLRAAMSNLAIPTLGGTAHLNGNGAVSAFDSIGGAAVTVPFVPGRFVGRSYADALLNLSFDNVSSAAAFLADEQTAATAFFSQLGPQATGTLLADVYERELGVHSATEIATGYLATNLGRALGHASHELPIDFANDVIGSRTRVPTLFDYEIGPEYLFAHGEFEADFLVAATAASLEVNADRSALSINDVRAPIVTAAAQAGVGVDLLLALDQRDAVDALLLMRGSPAPVAGLVRQASSNTTASRAVISAAATTDEVTLPMADALSQVLAENVADYVDAPADSPFFTSAELVFAAGAGFELDFAVRAQMVLATVDGFNSGGDLWWHELEPLGLFAGHIDGAKFRADEAGAMASDAAWQQRADRITKALTLASIGISVVGAAPALAAGTTIFAVTGVGVSGAGWWLPLGEMPNNAGQLHRSSIVPLMGFDSRGEDVALMSALLTGSIQPANGATVQVSSRDRDTPVITVVRSNGERVSILVATDSDWATELLAELPAHQQIELADGQTMHLRDALNAVGDQLFSRGYVEAFAETSGLPAD